ncbi:MAG: T9SS type A sorting domain-containing protein [Ginsengibacter sp.]
MRYSIFLIFALLAAYHLYAGTARNTTPGSGIKLLYYQDNGWTNAASWIQLGVPAGQPPIHRVPTADDDVIFSKAISHLDSILISSDSILVGGSVVSALVCHSLHISGTNLLFTSTSQILMGTGTLISVYTNDGGYVLIDSGSVVSKGLFQLHGGDSSIADLSVYNSTLERYFSHSVSSYVAGDNFSRINFVNSYFSGAFFDGGDNCHLFASNSTFDVGGFKCGDYSVDTIINCKIGCVTNGNIYGLGLGFGKNSTLFSDSNTVYEGLNTSIYTSGLSLKADLVQGANDNGTSLRFIQEDTANPLPNIIDGSIFMPVDWYNGLAIQGDLWISGDLTWASNIFAASNDSTGLYVNGKEAFVIGGIYNFYQSTKPTSRCAEGFCHYKLGFFGNKNSNISWPIGFPVDTLVVAKSNCAKVTVTNSLYVASETRIDSGQLALYPNEGVTIKFVCGGNLNISQGAGLLLQRDSLNNVTSIAVHGVINDQNSSPDSVCHGLSNPYGGVITLSAVLPIAFIDISGKYLQKSVLLSWKVGDAKNAKAFVIEKSFDGIQFSPVGQVNAIQNAATYNYQFTDIGNMAGSMYYKVAVIDRDGKISFSKVIKIDVPMQGQGITVYPNPVTDHLLIKNLPIGTAIHLSILDAKGAIVKEMILYPASSSLNINTSNLAAGIYVLLLRGTIMMSTVKLVKR